MCSPEVRKEANRLNWMVKGQLITKSEPDSVVEYLYDSYFIRRDIRRVTEACSVRANLVTANNIVRFSRQAAPVAA